MIGKTPRIYLANTPPRPPVPMLSGNLCGWDAGYEDLPNLYYVNTEGSGICVESCPDETDLRCGGSFLEVSYKMLLLLEVGGVLLLICRNSRVPETNR